MRPYKLKQLLFPSLIAILMLTTIPYAVSNTYAESNSGNDFVSVTEDNIKSNPLLAQILENIDKSKNEFSEIQQKTNQEKLIDEQRSIAKNILEQELDQMFKDNEEFTSLSAFNNFLKKVPDDKTKIVFQGLFDYHQEKVNNARNALYDVLKNGGTLSDARNAYHAAAKIPRTEMIQHVQVLNLNAGFSDPDVQTHFNNQGKLPRYDDEQKSIASFIDLTSFSKNVNSSVSSDMKKNTKTQSETDMHNKIDDIDTYNASEYTKKSKNPVIQQLLKEIQIVKDKIKELEKNTNSNTQNTIFEPRNIDSK